VLLLDFWSFSAAIGLLIPKSTAYMLAAGLSIIMAVLCGSCFTTMEMDQHLLGPIVFLRCWITYLFSL